MRIEAGEYPRKNFEKNKMIIFFWCEWRESEFQLFGKWSDILEKVRRKNISDKIFWKEVYLEKLFEKKKPYKLKWKRKIHCEDYDKH